MSFLQDAAKLAALKARTGDYYMDDVLLGALKASRWDVNTAFYQLNCPAALTSVPIPVASLLTRLDSAEAVVVERQGRRKPRRSVANAAGVGVVFNRAAEGRKRSRENRRAGAAS